MHNPSGVSNPQISFVLFSMQNPSYSQSLSTTHLHHCHCSSSSSLPLHCITMAESTSMSPYLLFLLSLSLIMPNGTHSYDNNTFNLQKSQKKQQSVAPGCLLPESSEFFCSKKQAATPTHLSTLFFKLFFFLLHFQISLLFLRSFFLYTIKNLKSLERNYSFVFFLHGKVTKYRLAH